MKKSLKLVAIFMIVLVVGVVGGISLYFLIANNKTYYVYDVRIVEPVSNEAYYVYTNPDAKYTSFKNKVVYMTNEENNSFEIGIFAHTSTGTTKVSVSSSNINVASVSTANGKLFVNYKGAGETNITASVGGVVKDSIKVTVYDIAAEGLSVFDDKYYGADYSKYFPNKVVAYADNTEYSYRIETSAISGGEFSDTINTELLAIDYTQIDSNIFPNKTDVKIDPVTKSLVVKCNSSVLSGNTDTIIPVQAFSKTADGEIRVAGNYFVQVHIITYIPQFLQIEVSKTPHFDEKVVLTNTSPIDISGYTEDEIYDNPSILNEFLQYQIAENGLNRRGEKSTYNVYFTDKISKLYLRFRKVYTNGDVVELNSLTATEHSFNLTYNSTYMKESADKTYYVLNLTEDNFNSLSDKKFKISLALGDYNLSHEFEFEFNNQDEASISKFYAYNSDSKTYTFTYWDERARYSEIYNENGEIIGFGAI